MKIKVALAEDNRDIASGLIDKLKIHSNLIELKFHAVNGNDLLKKLSSNKDIDVILMDIQMPEMDGMTATWKVKELYPHIKIIMLTVFDDDDQIFLAIQNGAIGYLLKEETIDVIVDAIKVVYEGGASMSPLIAQKVLKLLSQSELKLKQKNEVPYQDFELTKREIEILNQLKLGKDYKVIADELFISPFTVRKHIENIYTKLHVNNKMQAVQKAIQHNIIK